MKKMTAFGGSDDLTTKEKRRVIGQQDDCITKMENLDQNTPVFGIDLGTTNSAISVITKGDKPETIKLHSGKYTMPSCVMWKDGEFIVGDEAYAHRAFSNVIYSVKRFMQDPNKVVEFRDGSKSLKMTPAEVSAKILKGLVEQTDGLYGDIHDVVVTVPAYFDQNGRNATREACELAGLNLIDIINEPTAAALCYDVDVKDSTKDFITFDFGGGTLDITLARITSGDSDAALYGIEDDSDVGKVVQCLAIEGDSHLGGDDIDKEMFNVVAKRIEEATGVDANDFTLEYKEELILRLERLKKMGTDGIYSLSVETTTMHGQYVKQDVNLTSTDFMNALLPVYARCKKVMDTLLSRVPNNADTVVLVGGSTKNPLLVQLLKRDYPGFIFSDAVNQDLAVTLGAAIKGKIDKFGSDSVQIFDILPISIGVNDDGVVTPIISAGTVLPATASLPFTTLVDNQESMLLQLLQGKSSLPDECVSLGILEFDNIPAGNAGDARLSVTVTVDANSIMTCEGSINGEHKKLRLNLAGQDNTSLTKDEKLKKRWLKVADTLPAEKGEELRALVANYPDITSRKDISAFIRANSKALEEA